MRLLYVRVGLHCHLNVSSFGVTVLKSALLERIKAELVGLTHRI
jgi:hypothetical protein